MVRQGKRWRAGHDRLVGGVDGEEIVGDALSRRDLQDRGSGPGPRHRARHRRPPAEAQSDSSSRPYPPQSDAYAPVTASTVAATAPASLAEMSRRITAMPLPASAFDVITMKASRAPVRPARRATRTRLAKAGSGPSSSVVVCRSCRIVARDRAEVALQRMIGPRQPHRVERHLATRSGSRPGRADSPPRLRDRTRRAGARPRSSMLGGLGAPEIERARRHLPAIPFVERDVAAEEGRQQRRLPQRGAGSRRRAAARDTCSTSAP